MGRCRLGQVQGALAPGEGGKEEQVQVPVWTVTGLSVL